MANMAKTAPDAVSKLRRKHLEAVTRIGLPMPVPSITRKAIELRFKLVLGFHLVVRILHWDRVA